MNVSTSALPKGWLALAGVLVVLEVVFVFEAMMADFADYQRMFGVFAGLAILCFAALLYSVSVITYGWD